MCGIWTGRTVGVHIGDNFSGRQRDAAASSLIPSWYDLRGLLVQVKRWTAKKLGIVYGVYDTSIQQEYISIFNVQGYNIAACSTVTPFRVSHRSYCSGSGSLRYRDDVFRGAAPCQSVRAFGITLGTTQVLHTWYCCCRAAVR